jgi:HPt (histidine-containing phosphotransfer) domain-containing protein
MEKKHKNIDFQKVEEIVESDSDFRKQLLEAIILAAQELKEKYLRGIDEKDLERIKQARHKIKPTLGLFDLQKLSAVLGRGKQLFSDNGLHQELDWHKQELTDAIDDLVDEVREQLKK